MSRCLVGCLGQGRARCSKRCRCGLRNYPSDVRPTDPLAAGVESTSQTLALGVVFFTTTACSSGGLTAGLKYRGNDTTGCTQVILRHNRVLLFIQLE